MLVNIFTIYVSADIEMYWLTAFGVVLFFCHGSLAIYQSYLRNNPQVEI
jgi:hypothetical protein